MGVLTVNAVAADPAGRGLVTVTVTCPAIATSAAGTAAVIIDELTRVGLMGVSLPKPTTVAASNPEPLIVSVNPLAPTVTDAGLRLVIFGVALGTVTENDATDEPPPAEVLTTFTVVAMIVAISAAGTSTVNVVLLAAFAVSFVSVPKMTFVAAVKPVPVIVSVTPGAPAETEAGLTVIGAPAPAPRTA